MDLTPQTLREVEFREKLRGYHPDDVDAFLEQVALGIEVLQERARQATERAARAEQFRQKDDEEDEALRRTLVLAQRTADLAMQEAKDQAAAVISAAEQRAEAIVREADVVARRTAEEAQVRLRADIARLEAARDRLGADVAALEKYVADERERLRSSLVQQLERLELSAPLLAPAPRIHEVDLPPAPPMTPVADVPGGLGADTPPPPPPPLYDEEWGEPTQALEAVPAPPPQPEPVYAEPAYPASEPAYAEPGPAPVAGGDADAQSDAADEDPFLAELRRAVHDDSPLGPRDEQAPAGGDDRAMFEGDDDAGRLGSRLFRRR